MAENKTKVDLSTFEGKRMYERFAFEPDPSVCVTGCFDVTNLYKQKKKGHSFNAMLSYCILQAGQKIKEFHYSIKEDGLYYYNNVKINTVINGVDGQLYYIDHRYCEDFEQFEKEYVERNDYYGKTCEHFQEDTGALISTSAIIGYPFVSISCPISPAFWDNFMMWGQFVKKFNKVKLNISLRFNHATVDGQRAAMFFCELQNQIQALKTKRKK